MIRNLISRVCGSLRRSKPCGCAYPPGWSNDAVPQAHRVDDRVTDEDEYVVEYRCRKCEDTFELHEGVFLDHDLNE